MRFDTEPGPALPVVPVSPEPATPSTPAPYAYTGVLINAQHLSGLGPDQNSKILGPGETVLYPSPDNEPSPDDTQGIIIGYYKDEASSHTRCGSNPLILRATEVVDGISIRLSATDMARFQEADQHLHIAREWDKVGFLMK